MLEIIRRDNTTVDVQFTDRNNVPIDISDHVAYITIKAKKTDLDDDALLAKSTDTHVDPTIGKTRFVLNQIDTDIEPGIYYFDLQLKDLSNVVRSVKYGLVKIIQDVTIRTN